MLSSYLGLFKEFSEEIENHYAKVDLKKPKFFADLTLVLSILTSLSFIIGVSIFAESILLAVLGIVIFTVMFPYIFVFGFFYYGSLFVVLCEAVLKSIFKNHTKQATVAAYFLGAVLAIAFILLLLWRAFLEE